MRLEPAATRQINDARADVVDCGAPVILECNLSSRADLRLGSRRLRRRIGAPLLCISLRRQAQIVRKRLHRLFKARVEGRTTIVGRGEAALERRRLIVERGETLFERPVPAARRGGVQQRAAATDQCIEADLRLQACQPNAIDWGRRSERRADAENVRVNRPENRNTRARQARVRWACLRPGRFEDEPQHHRGDSERNRANPPLHQQVPPLPRCCRTAQRQRTSPDAGGRKHADCGKIGSERSL